jgi:hypothetical protein
MKKEKELTSTCDIAFRGHENFINVSGSPATSQSEFFLKIDHRSMVDNRRINTKQMPFIIVVI